MLNRKKIIESLFENFHSIKRQLLEGNIAAKNVEVTPAEGLLLRLVFNKDGMGVKEIANQLRVTSSAATQLIDSLVKKGFLVREQSQEDRRALIIKFSEKAKNKINLIRERSFNHLVILFEALSDEELKQYSELNQKIAKSILK